MKLPALLFSVCLLSVVTLFALQVSTDSMSKADHAVRARAAFAKAYDVFMHARCVKGQGESALRNEDSRLQLDVNGEGVNALECINCDQAENQHGLNVPPGVANFLSDDSLDSTPRRHFRLRTRR